MILILASALALISESVVCDLTPQGHDIPQHGPTGFTVACPADHEDAAAIQSAAEAAIAAMDLPLPRLRRQGGNPPPMLRAARQMRMQMEGGSWQPAPAQALVQAAPVLSGRTTARGSVSMLCAIGFTPGANGADPQPNTACISNPAIDTVVRQQTAAMMQLAPLWRFAPVNASYCDDRRFEIAATQLDRATGEQEEAPPAPDPDLLPNLCEAG
ncbi:hypothetical protein [Glycocaulis sp.]|uniref:hypothetical protein n=1 Tax=Glycocaulis sp. TaxID=1969725 RepID=UPI003D1A66D9